MYIDDGYNAVHVGRESRHTIRTSVVCTYPCSRHVSKKDTYYIRCTFTNPTDEPINKQIDHIKFMYNPHYADRAVYEKRPTRYCESIYQYNDTVTELSVPPHRTVSLSIPVTLPQSSDKSIIIEPQHIYFYFTDSTSLATYRKLAPAMRFLSDFVNA